MTRSIARSHSLRRRGWRKVRPAVGTIFGVVLSVVLGLAFLTADPVCANEQRRNTPSFGVQYGYGAFNGTGVFEWEGNNPEVPNRKYPHQDFRYGGALGFRIRYSLDQTHAVGLSFDDLRFGRKSGLENPQNPELEPARQLQVTTYVVNYYLYVDRRARTTAYLLLGGGLHQDTFRFGKYDNVATTVSPCANLGIGVEYFVRPAWSIDATLRGAWLGQRARDQLQFHGSSPLASSLQLGFQYYLIK